MRIAFVTGCLEPGRDGVGDYTRALAGACRARGHEVALLSLAERRPGPIDSAPDECRLNADTWRGDRGRGARAWLGAFRPDWASLQFVPYSFDPRGFFGASIGPLADLLATAPQRHLFFHELWIGSHRGARLHERWSGWRQRRAVAALLRRLAPARIGTSTAYYCSALAALGWEAERRPVFGAVPRSGNVSPTIAGVPGAALVCGHFGTLHPCRELPGFLGDFAALAQRLGRPAMLVAAGGLGYGEAWFRQLAEEWHDRVTFLALGRLESRELAAAFARFDCAVTSVPWRILGKSSSAAALREHGVRVIVVGEGAPPRFPHGLLDDAEEDPGFVPYFRDRALLAQALEKTPPRPGVERAAEQLLADLAAVK